MSQILFDIINNNASEYNKHEAVGSAPWPDWGLIMTSQLQTNRDHLTIEMTNNNKRVVP